MSDPSPKQLSGIDKVSDKVQDSKKQWAEKLPAKLHDWLDGRKADDVECIVSDLAGISRGKTMPCLLYTSDAADE